MRLSDIMSTPVVTILSTAAVSEARAKMQRDGIRHLVVLGREREIAGVVCSHDLGAAPPGSDVDEVMSTPAITLPASAGVQEAVRLFRRRKVGSVPLMDGKRLVGIVTTSDLLAVLERTRRSDQ